MQVNNNVVIIGAGPVGITTACVLKAINKDLNINVVDKRIDPKRNHGLSIKNESIIELQKLLDQALITQPHSTEIKSLKNIFKNWGGHFVRTNEIELTFAEIAKKMGVEVLRDSNHEISKGDLNLLLNTTSLQPIPKEKEKLKALFTCASVIIAADGAHSVIREDLGIKLVDEDTLKYMAELKYQTDGNTQPRSYGEASVFSSKTGHVTFEVINQRATSTEKPGTFFTFIDSDTFKAMQTPDSSGKVKGVYGNAWNLDELKEKCQVDHKLRCLFNTLKHYVLDIKARKGTCEDEKIVAVELKIYRAEESVKSFGGKQILLIGDADSGLVLQQGFNKGLKEVALCAKAVNEFFFNRDRLETVLPVNSIAKEFLAYQTATAKLFEREKRLIFRKTQGIKVAEILTSSLASSLYVPKKLKKSSINKLDTSTRKINRGLTNSKEKFSNKIRNVSRSLFTMFSNFKLPIAKMYMKPFITNSLFECV